MEHALAQPRKKFATQIDPDILEEMRKMAKAEGRQLQTLVEDALRAFLEERRGAKPRPHVMSAYQKSHARYSGLYKNLAK